MLRFLLDKLAFCGFRLTLPEIFESENRHVYFSCVIPCTVDITLLELSNWSWTSVTSRLLAVDFAIFLTSFVLFTSVLQCATSCSASISYSEIKFVSKW